MNRNNTENKRVIISWKPLKESESGELPKQKVSINQEWRPTQNKNGKRNLGSAKQNKMNAGVAATVKINV